MCPGGTGAQGLGTRISLYLLPLLLPGCMDWAKLHLQKVFFKPSPAGRQDQAARGHHLNFTADPAANLSKALVIYICLG